MKKNILLYAITALLLFKNCTPATVPATVTDCTYNGISRDELVAMIRTYSSGQLGHINNGMRTAIDDSNRSNNAYDPNMPSRFEDARTIFFKLDTLQQFFEAVKCAVQENDLKTESGEPIMPADIGVRIYYTAYPGLAGKPGVRVNEETKKGHHTLVFVATYFDRASKRNLDFDPEEYGPPKSGGGNYNVPRLLNDPSFNGSKARYFALFSGPSDPVVESDDEARNQGELCPPPKGCGTELLKIVDSQPIR